MQLLLGFVLAIATGILAVFAMTWTGRCTVTPRRQDSNLKRWFTLTAARPIATEAGTRSRGAEPRQFAHGLCPKPPEITSSTVQLSTDGVLFWMTSHDLRATGMPASGSTHREDGVWKVITFARHIPRLSAEERQRLLTAWGDRHPVG